MGSTTTKTYSKTPSLRRLAWGSAVGVVVGLLAVPLPGISRVLLGWTVGALVYLAQAYWVAKHCDPQTTRAHAQSQDQPDLLILVVTIAAVSACAAAITMLLQQVQHMKGIERIAYVALAFGALVTAWLLIHTIYAFHYAHRYYQRAKGKVDENGGGLDFPGKTAPRYSDFLYFSFVIGMTSQVSDVQVTSADMRVLTLVQSILAFGFNVLVLALSINVVAGAVSGGS